MEMGMEVRSEVAISSPQPFPCLALVCLGAAETPTSREVAERVTVHYHSLGARRT
jgi:hypothetical protein